MEPTCRLYRRRGQHRDTGGCPSSSHLEAKQLILFLYVSGAYGAAVPSQEPGECLQANESVHNPLRGAGFCLTWTIEIPNDFYRQIFMDTGTLGGGAPVQGWNSSMETSAVEITTCKPLNA